MSKLEYAFAAALSTLLLTACAAADQAPADNNAVAAEAAATGNVAGSDPVQPAPPANASDDPVPPPDAVSHPDGYLPPAPDPAEPAPANSSGPDKPPPATEDEYLRNR